MYRNSLFICWEEVKRWRKEKENPMRRIYDEYVRLFDLEALNHGPPMDRLIHISTLKATFVHWILLSTQHVLLAPCSHAQNDPALVNLRKCKLMRKLTNVALLK
jgi:hypothetical protein